MLLLRQLKLPLLPLQGCAGELGLSQPGSPGMRGAEQVNLRRAVLDRMLSAGPGCVYTASGGGSVALLRFTGAAVQVFSAPPAARHLSQGDLEWRCNLSSMYWSAPPISGLAGVQREKPQGHVLVLSQDDQRLSAVISIAQTQGW
ncbi:unnamed protein product [Pleuronectes platessa]|uniref:Uncharacterized protein n=1 Tax=Pleuronectes platessa TaxID=8262 RepID=A0A9N7VGY3_PLEPL|nr:unnamed protein product [Pleuronectes platessa]